MSPKVGQNPREGVAGTGRLVEETDDGVNVSGAVSIDKGEIAMRNGCMHLKGLMNTNTFSSTINRERGIGRSLAA